MRVDENGNWRAFRHRNFRILFPANALSNIGTWVQIIAQDWLVLQLTDNNGFYLGLVTAIQFVPVMLLSLHGGVLADRVDKRKLLIATNTLAALACYALGILVVAEVIELWHVFVCAAVLGIASAIDAPIRQSFTAEIVGDDDVANAVSLNSANFNMGRLVGPALSGILIANFDTGPSFLINATSYLFVIGSLFFMRSSDFFSQKKEKTLGTIREGLHYAMARPDLYVVMALIFFASTFGLNFQIFNALMATKEFGKGPASYGLLGTYVAIGSLAGALISARLERFRDSMLVVRLGVLFSLVVIATAFMPTYWTYSLWLPIGGVSALAMLISANSYVQVNSDPAVRGRVMGIYLLIFMGGTPLGSLFIGYMTEAVGVRETIFICGVIPLVAATLLWVFFKDKLQKPDDLRVSTILKR
ncbi:AraJ Arabinose efflux permease [Candidatus Nanopelagicaceae bacterium]